MCRSMRARGIKGNEEILTRRKYPKDKKERKREEHIIRSKAKCVGRKCPPGQSCDEYPPASTEEGYDGLYGIDVFSQCIDEDQNSLGGNALSVLYGQQSTELPSGGSFISRVTGIDCSTIPPANPGPPQQFPPRDVGGDELIGQGNETVIYPPMGDYPLGFGLAAFGDLEPGSYAITFTSSAPIESWDIIDAPALQIASGDSIPANKETTIDFTLEDPAFGVGLAAFTKADAIELEWSISVTSSTPSPTPSSEPEPTAYPSSKVPSRPATTLVKTRTTTICPTSSSKY
ncbi:hypothetical protein FQN50_005209 [Emmonsiellopsis sp. PD_5]|nr:hypothetical protein FQN50_005209 [Emmonsiellopsis sp. PD_5]